MKIDDLNLCLSENGYAPIPVWEDSKLEIESKKISELFYLYRLFNDMNMTPSIIVGTESPDFLVYIGNDRVGIEITQIYKDQKTEEGHTLRQTEAYRSNVIRKIGEYYYSNGGKPVILRLNLSKLKYSNDDIVAMAGKLFKYADMPIWKRIEIELECGDKMCITRAPDDFEADTIDWSCINDSAGWVAEIDEGKLDAIVSRKAKKLHQYKDKCCSSDIILLIVADYISNSGMLSCKIPLQISPRGFHSIYLYDASFQKTFKLTP